MGCESPEAHPVQLALGPFQHGEACGDGRITLRAEGIVSAHMCGIRQRGVLMGVADVDCDIVMHLSRTCGLLSEEEGKYAGVLRKGAAQIFSGQEGQAHMHRLVVDKVALPMRHGHLPFC